VLLNSSTRAHCAGLWPYRPVWSRKVASRSLRVLCSQIRSARRQLAPTAPLGSRPYCRALKHDEPKGASHAIRRMVATRLQAGTKPPRAHEIREYCIHTGRMTQELQEHSVRCYAHKLKPLNHVTVIPHPLSPPRFNSHGRGYSPVVFPTPLLLV